MTSLAMIPPPPHQMVADIAYGMEEPVDIAYRYGYAASQFHVLEQHPPFLAAVAQARSELERNGHGVKVKAQWMTEKLLDDLFIKASSVHASIGQVQDTIKIMAKLADLEPKGNGVVTQAGTGFSVVINIPQQVKTEGTTEKGAAQFTFPDFSKSTSVADAENIKDIE